MLMFRHRARRMLYLWLTKSRGETLPPKTNYNCIPSKVTLLGWAKERRLQNQLLTTTSQRRQCTTTSPRCHWVTSTWRRRKYETTATNMNDTNNVVSPIINVLLICLFYF